MRILAISGSLRRDSQNTRLLRHMAEQAPDGVEIEIWDGLKSIPPYDEDDDVDPARRRSPTLREAIAEADGLLFATPEYNSSIPGVLKNAIDWASRPRRRPRSRASPRRSSAPRPVSSAPSGRRPSSARCWPRPAPVWSTSTCRWRRRTPVEALGGLLEDENGDRQCEKAGGALLEEIARDVELSLAARDQMSDSVTKPIGRPLGRVPKRLAAAGPRCRRTRQRAPVNARFATVAKPSSSSRSASRRWATRSAAGSPSTSPTRTHQQKTWPAAGDAAA